MKLHQQCLKSTLKFIKWPFERDIKDFFKSISLKRQSFNSDVNCIIYSNMLDCKPCAPRQFPVKLKCISSYFSYVGKPFDLISRPR